MVLMAKKKATEAAPAMPYEVFRGEVNDRATGEVLGFGWGIRRLEDGVILRRPRNEQEREAVEEQCRGLNERLGPRA